MEDQQKIKDVLLRLNSDLLFLLHKGVISRKCQMDYSKYIDKAYRKYTCHESYGPLQADQPPLRPPSPLLIDMDTGIGETYHGRHSIRKLSVSTIATANGGRPTTDPGARHSYPTNAYDIDQHERETAAEWLGTPSSGSLSEGSGPSTVGGISPCTATAATTGFAIKGMGDKNKKKRRDRRSRSYSHNDHEDHQSRQTQQYELQQSIHAPPTTITTRKSTYASPRSAIDPGSDNWSATSINDVDTHATSNCGPPSDQVSAKPSPAVSQNTICPFWLSFGSCKQNNCQFAHVMIPGIPREKLECAFWRTASGCTRDGCEFEHHPTAHGLQGKGGRMRRH